MKTHHTSPKESASRRGRRLPHLDQARTWYRYATRLQGRPYDASLRREEALAYSLRLGARSLVFPARLEAVPEAEQGLRHLVRWLADAAQGVRFLELAARIVEVEEEDPAADEVHLFVEEPDRTSSRNRRHLVGRLPREDAFWAVPLLRLEDDPYGTGPVLRIFVVRGSTSEVRLAIAHAHEAARHWIDWKEEGTHRFNRSYRRTFYDERVYGEA